MKKAKLLTVLGVMLAMGVTACTGTETSSNSSQGPAPSSTSSTASTSSTSSSTSSSSSQSGGQGEVADPDGHHFGADADVAADAEAGTVAYKKAECADNDGFLRLKVNQSVVTYASGSTRKDGTPDGYTKLTSNNQSFSFKMKVDKKYSGKLFFFGCMDGWSTDGNRNAGFYRSGTPSAKVEVNGVALDASAQQDKKYRDYFGEEQIDTDMASPSDHLSYDGYAPFAPVVLNEGVNEIKYTRVQTQNMLIKDFVFVVEEYSDWTAEEPVAAKGDGYVGYTKRTSRIDGATKIEIKALDGSFAEGSTNKNGTEEGYLKLNSNGNKISWKFDFDKAGFAQIYQIGFMDSFSSNTHKTYANTSSTSDTKTEKGNFELTVNEAVVDKGAYMNISFQDLTADGEVLFAEDKNYSPVALLPIGTAALVAGDNTIQYERLGSYNFAMSKLVIYFYETAPVPSTAVKGDGNGHWNEYEGLPKARFNYAAHTIEETAFTNSQGKEGKVKTCSACGQMVGAEMDLLACDDATSITDGALALNTAYTWRFKLGEANAAAGKAAFYMTVKRGAASTNLASGYTLSSGEVNGTVTCINERIGSGYSSAKELKIGEITIEKLDANGEFVVTFKTPEAQDNMPIWSGAVRLAYIG